MVELFVAIGKFGPKSWALLNEPKRIERIESVVIAGGVCVVVLRDIEFELFRPAVVVAIELRSTCSRRRLKALMC